MPDKTIECGITTKDLKDLKAEFDPRYVSIKPQAFTKDKKKAMMVLYLSHPAVVDRVEKIDPNFSFHCGEFKNGSITGTLSIKGISRSNVGEGDTAKSAASDCFKRCAMLFGVGRYLYEQDMIWVPWNDKMKFHKYMLADLEDLKLGKSKGQDGVPGSVNAGRISDKAVKYLNDLITKASEKTDVTAKQIINYFLSKTKVKTFNNLTRVQGDWIINALKETIDNDARVQDLNNAVVEFSS